MVFDFMFFDDTMMAIAADVFFYLLFLVAFIVIPVLIALFAGILIQYTFRLIRRRFLEGRWIR